MMELFKSLLIVIVGSTIAFYATSEYVDYRIKEDLAYELNINKEHITFLYSKDEECEEDQYLYDPKLGICIDNIAFDSFTDTDVGM